MTKWSRHSVLTNRTARGRSAANSEPTTTRDAYAARVADENGRCLVLALLRRLRSPADRGQAYRWRGRGADSPTISKARSTPQPARASRPPDRASRPWPARRQGGVPRRPLREPRFARERASALDPGRRHPRAQPLRQQPRPYGKPSRPLRFSKARGPSRHVHSRVSILARSQVRGASGTPDEASTPIGERRR